MNLPCVADVKRGQGSGKKYEHSVWVRLMATGGLTTTRESGAIL